MTDFFQALSAIGDTLVNNRTRSFRERTLADLGEYLGGGDMDYQTLAAKLMAAGDVRSGLLALNLGARQDPRLKRVADGATSADAAAASASVLPFSGETNTALLTSPSFRRQFEATYGAGSYAGLSRPR